MLCSAVVGCTITLSNLRARAASPSMHCLYSSSVVAPIMRIAPRASAGLRMLAASNDPSAEPAPTMVCISSINSIASPLSVSCSIISDMRCSNSPRYFVPATIRAISNDSNRLPIRFCGTLLLAMRAANASAMALLPTPASPTSMGLLFLRRDSMRITRSVSCSLPTTGSILPCRASAVRSVIKSIAFSVVAGVGSVLID